MRSRVSAHVGSPNDPESGVLGPNVASVEPGRCTRAVYVPWTRTLSCSDVQSRPRDERVGVWYLGISGLFPTTPDSREWTLSVLSGRHPRLLVGFLVCPGPQRYR